MTFDQWDLIPNQHQRMHEEQEEIEHSRKGHERECPSSIKECTGQQHSELIVEQIYTSSPNEQHKQCLDEWQWDKLGYQPIVSKERD